MPASYQTYTADGNTQSFPVPFPYLDRAHVFLNVSGAPMTFTWDTPQVIRPDTKPPAGSLVEIRRFTPTTPPTDFTNGAVLMEDTLDLLARYCAYLAEETREGGSGGSGGSWTPYTLPMATAYALGGIKVGNNLTIDPTGVLSAVTGGTPSAPYVLPKASPTVLGGIKVGANLSINSDGVLSASAPGASAPLGGVAIGSFTMDQATPNARVVFTDTNPAGWNGGVGRMTLDAEVYFNNYFAANPTGHIAIVLRNTSDIVASAVRGHGVAIGDARGFGYNPVSYYPVGMIESWSNPYPPGSGGPSHTLPQDSEMGNGAQFKDGVPYRIIIESTKANDGNRYIRFRVYKIDATQPSTQWLNVHDTGDVLDSNAIADLTKYGLAFGHVLGSNLSPWSIQFTNCKVTWGPASDALPDLRARLGKYGGDIEGDVNFVGNDRRLRLRVGDSFPFDTWTMLQSAAPDSATPVSAIPSGAGTSSGFTASNSSSKTSFGSVGLTMDATRARLATFSLGAEPVRNIDVILQNTHVGSFTPSGYHVAGALLPIGSEGSNYGGTSMNASVVGEAAGTTMDYATMCTSGYIASQFNTYGALGIEAALKPLYGALGRLITDLKARKII